MTEIPKDLFAPNRGCRTCANDGTKKEECAGCIRTVFLRWKPRKKKPDYETCNCVGCM